MIAGKALGKLALPMSCKKCQPAPQCSMHRQHAYFGQLKGFFPNFTYRMRWEIYSQILNPHRCESIVT
jgi:hypothetical protein